MKNIHHVPARHPLNRLSDAMKDELINAQANTIESVFSSAFDFCETVLSDLKIAIAPPESMREKPVADVGDLEYSDLVDLYDGIISASVPLSARQMQSHNLARRSQLVRAFEDPDAVLAWVTQKVTEVIGDLPKTASDIEVGRNPGDVLDPYLIAATQALLCEGDFRQAIGATVSHKALMILEGLMGHLHEEVIGRMRGNVRNPEPRSDNAEILDFQFNPFPGADVVQPPQFNGDTLKLHQIKSKTGTMNSSGGKRLAEQMRQLRMTYQNAELFSHSLVGNTLRGHRSMGGMIRVEPSLVVLVGQASFSVLTSSESGPELLVRVYQSAFELAALETGYSVENMTSAIVQTFTERADEEGEGYLESIVHKSTRGNAADMDSRTYQGRRAIV